MSQKQENPLVEFLIDDAENGKGFNRQCLLLAKKFGFRGEDAEDFYQELCIKTLDHSAKNFNPSYDRVKRNSAKKTRLIRGYLSKTYTNICIDALRGPRAVNSIGKNLFCLNLESRLEHLAAMDGLPMDKMIAKEDLSESYKILYQIPDINKIPYLLSRIENYQYDEIAERLKIPIGTVKSRIHNANQKIKKIVAEINAD